MKIILNNLEKNVINVCCLTIGFALLAYSSYELYTATHEADNCIIKSLNSSLSIDSNNKKFLNATIIDQALPICYTQTNSDTPYAILQLFGLYIPVLSVLVTTQFKEEKKSKSKLSQEDRRDALGTHGYS